MRRERLWDRVGDFFRARVGAEETYEIDDRTWSDLGLGSVFDGIDRTLTVAGEQVLYANLRRPAISGPALARRQRLLSTLEESPARAEVIRGALASLGTADGDCFADFLWRANQRALPSPWIHRLGALAAVASLALAVFVSPLAGGGALLGVMLMNLWLHGRMRLHGESDLQSVRYLARFLVTAHRLARSPELAPAEREPLARLDRESRSLRRKLSVQRVLQTNLFDEFLGTLNVVFLIEARAQDTALREMGRLRPLLQEGFALLGALDCARSIVIWRREGTWTEPALSEEERHPVVVDVVHPLLEEPIANSIALERGGLLVTGSNMSGKSTFLRAFGLAAVLGQGLATVPARSYRGPFLRVRSVMSGSDDLLARKSYYLDEALAVRQTVELVGTRPPLLCIFDEMFRGTNSTERVAAGASVVRWMTEQGALVLLATHDLQLATLLEGELSNVHFADEVGPEGLTFDHRLRPGRATRTNALDVLAHVGYPSAIVEGGRRIAAGLTAIAPPITDGEESAPSP